MEEIRYDGEYIDVTTFRKRHPGGNIINFYINNEEDATHAIEQFHNRSFDKVMKIMKTLKRRPISTGPQKTDRNENALKVEDLSSSTANDALTKDFNILYENLKEEGLFKPSRIHNIYRLLELVFLAYIGYQFLLFENLFMKFIGCCLIGLSQGRSGWVQHECGHKSFTGLPKIERIFHDITIGVGLGLSSTFWNRGHNKHHAMPQRINHDVDLETLPLLLYNINVIKDRKQARLLWVKYQKYLFPISTFVGMIIFQFYKNPRYVLKHKLPLQAATILVHHILCYQIGFIPWVISTFFLSFYLFGHFTLSHTHLPTTTDPNHWVEYSFIHTANVQPSWWCDWVMGYLNYQIEHHLFPAMPQFRLPFIRDRVKQLAEKHNLPYYVYPYFGAWVKTFHNLGEVAKKAN